MYIKSRISVNVIYIKRTAGKSKKRFHDRTDIDMAGGDYAPAIFCMLFLKGFLLLLQVQPDQENNA